MDWHYWQVPNQSTHKRDSTNHDFQKKLTSVSLLWKSSQRLPTSRCVEPSDQASMHCPCGDRLTLPGQNMIGHSQDCVKQTRLWQSDAKCLQSIDYSRIIVDQSYWTVKGAPFLNLKYALSNHFFLVIPQSHACAIPALMLYFTVSQLHVPVRHFHSI